MASARVGLETDSTLLPRGPELTSSGLLALFECAPLAQLVILPDDPVFTMAAASDLYVQASGAKRQDLLGRSVFEIFPDNPGDPGANGVRNLRASLQRVISTKVPDQLAPQRYDVERPKEEGGGFEERYWNTLNTPVLGPNGGVEFILHSVEEVTKKVFAEQRAQQAMREWQRIWQDSGNSAEQRLRRAQRAGRVGSFEWLLKENRAICTPELEALYGLPEGTFQAGFEHWSKWVVPEDAERVVAQLESCKAQKLRECVYEFRVILPDRSVRWLRGQAQFHYDEAGVPERMIGVNIDIDAQKQAEAQLRESEERLRAIYDGTYEYIWLLAPDGILLEANRASLEFAGNIRDQVVGRPFWETSWFVGTQGAAERVRQAVTRAAGGEFVRFEAALRRPSGECPTFDISLHPVRNDRGEVVLIVPEGRDITEQKESKEQLRQQWLTFDTTLSNIPDFAYTFDLEGRFTYVNSALLSLWQTPLEDALGKNFLELEYPPALAARLQSQIQEVIHSKQPLRDETPFTSPTGETRHYEYIFVPVLAPDDHVSAVAGSTRDITDRERMERALAASEEKLQRVFAQAPVAIVVFRGRDFKVELANPTYQALLRGRELVGHRLADVVPELKQEVWDVMRRVLDTGEPFTANEWHIPYDADGDGELEDHWFNVAYNPWRDLDGPVSGMIAVFTDVTTQVLARQELERVNRELEEFSYVASHDLQEPLRMVNIYTQLLLRRVGAGENSTLSQYAAFVREGVRRMETLLADLLTYSRAVHTDAVPTGTADLAASLSEALSVLNGRVAESAALITAGPLPLVRGDTQQLAHVFQNLLSNALKYKKADQPPEIHIWAERQGEEWMVAVQDNGIGFEPRYAERIFGLFKRLHKDEYPGTGLGLAICQRVVARYGGRMWAESKLGEGATFRFALPAV